MNRLIRLRVRLGYRLIGEEERAATHLRYVTAVYDELAASGRLAALADPLVADALAALTTQAPDLAASEARRLGIEDTQRAPGPLQQPSFMAKETRR